MRIYDPRLGRFLSVDPITKDYPELTPYQFASNRPVEGIDIDGMEVGYLDPYGHYSMPSDAMRHPIPKGAYLPSIGAATGGWENAKGTMMVLGGGITTVAAAPTVAALSSRAFWSIAMWASVPSNQMTAVSVAGFIFKAICFSFEYAGLAIRKFSR